MSDDFNRGTRNFDSVSTEQEAITKPVVRAWKDGETYTDYKIEAYSDLAATANAAIQDMPAEGGKIELPHGIFTIAEPIQIDRSLRIVGQQFSTSWDNQGTLLRMDNGANTNLIETSVTDIYEIQIEHLTLNGNKANNTSGKGIYLDTAHDVWIEQVFIGEIPGRAGIDVNGGHDIFYERGQIEKCSGRAIEFRGGVDDTTVRECFPMWDNGNDKGYHQVLYNGAGDRHLITGTRITAGNEDAVRVLSSGYGIKISDCYFERVGQNAVKYTDTSLGKVSGCTFDAGASVTINGLVADNSSVQSFGNDYTGTFSGSKRVTANGASLTTALGGGIDINPTSAYSPSNDTADRALDADNTTTAELADVVATLIRDLGLDN